MGGARLFCRLLAVSLKVVSTPGEEAKLRFREATLEVGMGTHILMIFTVMTWKAVGSCLVEEGN